MMPHARREGAQADGDGAPASQGAGLDGGAPSSHPTRAAQPAEMNSQHGDADRQSATARALDDQSLMAVPLHLRSNALGRRASSTRFIPQAASSCPGA